MGSAASEIPKFVHLPAAWRLDFCRNVTACRSGQGRPLEAVRGRGGRSGNSVSSGNNLGDYYQVLVAARPPCQRFAMQLQRVADELVAETEGIKAVGRDGAVA